VFFYNGRAIAINTSAKPPQKVAPLITEGLSKLPIGSFYIKPGWILGIEDLMLRAIKFGEPKRSRTNTVG